MIKKILRALLIILVIVAIVMGGLKLVKDKRAKEAELPIAKVYPLVLKTMIPKKENVRLTLPYLAQVINEDNVVLSSPIAGRVLSIKESGENVKKGEVLVRLDTTELNANINSVNISLKNLLLTHKRTKALYRVKGASIEQLQKEESGIASLRAKLESLKNKLGYTTIKAPLSGVIAKNFVSVGTVSMPGKPLLSISSKEGFSLIVRLPDDTKAKKIIFKDKIYPLSALDTTFHGLHEYKAVINRSNISAGESVNIDVVLFDKEAQELPFDTILDRNGKHTVFISKGHKTVAKEVHIVQKGQEGVVVKEQFSGEKIIVAKPDILLKLLTGIAIKVEE